MFKQELIVSGHLNKHENASLRSEGWRLEKPNVNKNGIPVQTK